LYNLWKADKRSGTGGNELFGGADTIIVLTGKAAEETVYVKNNAVHVSSIPLESPVLRAMERFLSAMS
jgi:hypothetical protein